MAEPIEVEVRLKCQAPVPVAFRVRGQRRTITDVGRKWRKGGELHYLVMAGPQRVFELAYHRDEGRWRLIRGPQEFLQTDPTA